MVRQTMLAGMHCAILGFNAMKAKTIECPDCGAAVWDYGMGHKLPKCWNSADHASGRPLAFEREESEPESISPEQLEQIAAGFLDCAAWADCEEGTSPRITRKAKENAARHFAVFVAHCEPLVAQALETVSPTQFGHDLYLTIAGLGLGLAHREELRISPCCTSVQGIDRDGKTYACRTDTLGNYLSDIAHCKSHIGKFEKCYIEQYRGWIYFNGVTK